MATVKARITRDVIVRGQVKTAGEIVDLTHLEFNEMLGSHYAVRHVEPEPAPAAAAPATPAAQPVPQPQAAPEPQPEPKKGK